MLEISMIIIGFLLLLIGLVGAILPVLPGPIFTFLGLLVFHFFIDDIDFEDFEIIIYALITSLVFFIDYLFQFYGVKQFGGGKNALLGTMIGIICGFFLVPLGLIIGPFLGAFFGAILDNKEQIQALKIASGAVLGFFFGTLVKLGFSIFIIYLIIQKILYLFL